jgi:uncharacterized radical SAM superfamily Fe-S cluster-containing enzyme
MVRIVAKRKDPIIKLFGPISVQKLARKFRRSLSELTRSERRSLIICTLKFHALHNAIVNRKISKKYAGTKPRFDVALLIADLVVQRVADISDFDRLASGSYWEGVKDFDDPERLKTNRLERCVRAVLHELGNPYNSLHAQARRAKKLINQIKY